MPLGKLPELSAEYVNSYFSQSELPLEVNSAPSNLVSNSFSHQSTQSAFAGLPKTPVLNYYVNNDGDLTKTPDESAIKKARDELPDYVKNQWGN
jgi:hypothetical protein